jgi:hypothetical protein
MTFCLGSLLKTIKQYEIDQSKSNIRFVNSFLKNLAVASDENENVSYWLPLDKSLVSKLLSCKREVPKHLKQNLDDHCLASRLTTNLRRYVDENLQYDCRSNLITEILKLFDKTDSKQLLIYNKLLDETRLRDKSIDKTGEEPDLSTFLSLALIEACKTTNVLETYHIISRHGNSILSCIEGDLFKFAFGNRARNKNIIVIPVNSAFDLHITRKKEAVCSQIVSEQTLHGMWIERMFQRSYSKKFSDNKWSEIDEHRLKERILNDLKIRRYKTNENSEYPLGTIAVIEEENSIFYLLAISQFDSNNNAQATPKQIKSALSALVRFYDHNGQSLDLYLPLIGTGMSRAGLSNQESFEMICQAFDPAKNAFTGKVTIVIKPSIFPELNLKEEKNDL